MTHPLVDPGFTIWHGDLDTQLKRIHGVTLRELNVDRRFLQGAYYAGDNVIAVLDRLVREHRL